MSDTHENNHHHHECCGPGYPSPAEAMKAEREKLVYTALHYSSTGIKAPDYIATVDVDPDSETYRQVIYRTLMPNIGDELHDFGWNACSSCYMDETKSRRFLIVPGFGSGRIHFIDTAEPRAPKLHKVLEAEEIKEKTNLSAPHTVHCLGDGTVMISMLGDGDGNAPGGFLSLDENFNIIGRWENSAEGMKFNSDFWYQPRHNVMVSCEFAAPNTYYPGFDVDDVADGLYGTQIHFWDWQERKIIKSYDLGEEGLSPLEVRFLHDPDSTHGYVGAALSGGVWHWYKKNGDWKIHRAIEVTPVETESWPFPVSSLIAGMLISLDDRYLYFGNWLHGDIRQYDISDPHYPRLTGQVWCGGVLGRSELAGKELLGGPVMLQLSLDGNRLYVTNSLISGWDNLFYPDLGQMGSSMLQIDCDVENGGMEINPNFYVDFGNEPNGPARAHEMRFPGGDSTSDIWI